MIVTFDTQTALTANGSSPLPGCDLGNPANLTIQPGPLNVSVLLNVTTVSGTTPSLAVEIQWSNDGVNFASNATTPDTLPAITAAGNVVKQFPTKGRFARLVYTVTGTTPSFAFTATAYCV